MHPVHYDWLPCVLEQKKRSRNGKSPCDRLSKKRQYNCDVNWSVIMHTEAYMCQRRRGRRLCADLSHVRKAGGSVNWAMAYQGYLITSITAHATNSVVTAHPV